MKTSALLFNLMVIALICEAQGQTSTVTPQTLIGWTLAGSDLATLSQSVELTLPAGTQLSRSFDSKFANVKFNGRPVFAAKSEDFVTLEAGPAAVAFVRDGNSGQMVLVIGDDQVVTLPFTIKINADGLSPDPIDIQLAYERTSGVVEVKGFGQTLDYPAGLSARPIEVVVTAGAHAPLVMPSLIVQVDSPTVIDATVKTGTDDASKSKSISSEPLAKIRKSVGGRLDTSGSSAARVATNPRSAPKVGHTALEIYTPAAVRQGRADFVRAAVTKAVIAADRQ